MSSTRLAGVLNAASNAFKVPKKEGGDPQSQLDQQLCCYALLGNISLQQF